MSILNKDCYAARWLWDQGKDSRPVAGDQPRGQPRHLGPCGRRGATAGHVPWVDSYADDDFHERERYTPVLETGIKAFRWAKSVDDVHAVLANPRADKFGAVPILNSWGSGLPHRVWLPDAS
jgi:hypothetical protein